VTLRRWLALVAVIAAVLSTVEGHCPSPPMGTSSTRFWWVDVGFSGTPLYLRAGESTYSWRYMIFLSNRYGWGPKYIADGAGTRIVLGEATDPYYLIPAIWLRRTAR
jgi:hypothetical protein